MISSPLSPKGRLRRLHFFIAFIALNVFTAVLDRAVEQQGSSPYLYLFYGLAAWPFVTLMVKRAHDAGRDGKFVATALSLLIGSALVLIIGAGLIGEESDSMLAIIAALILVAICLVGFIMTLIVYFAPGKPGANKYGPNPRLRAAGLDVSGRGEPDDALIDLAALRGYSTGD